MSTSPAEVRAIERPRRNDIALAALWTALATYLLLIATAAAIGADVAGENVFDVVAWVALGLGTLALVLSVIGITMIRTRGDTAVAILALVLTLSLTNVASPLFFGLGLYGGF